MRDTPPNCNSIVAKNNELVGKLAKFELSEFRLLSFCIAHYDSRPESFVREAQQEFTARVDDLKELFKMSTKDAYAVVRRTMLGINKKPLELTDYDDLGEYTIFINWFEGFKYRPGLGEFTFYLSNKIIPYLLALKGNFTHYRLRDVYQFRKANTWKLYECLAQWRKAGRWAVDLNDLRQLLGVAGKYPRWSSLEQRLITPAISEINKYSDLRIEYSQEKRGRQIIGLVFLIDKKIDPAVINQDPPEDDLCKLLLDQGVNAKTAQDYAKKINNSGKNDTIIAKMPRIVARAQKSKGPAAKYILGAINNELTQMSLFEAPREAKQEHTESLDCWTAKRQKSEACPVRQRGKAGQRKKCQICLDKLPIDTFGV